MHNLLLVRLELLLEVSLELLCILDAGCRDHFFGVLLLESDQLSLYVGAYDIQRVLFHQNRHLFLNILIDKWTCAILFNRASFIKAFNLNYRKVNQVL